MADRTPLKVADHNDIADDDPFAELTRIMGFDPRQPVRQPAPAAEKANQAVEADDFDIDLEKELMGEFDSVEESAPVAQQAALHQISKEPAFEAASAAANDDELTASFEQDFVFDDAADYADFAVARAPEPDFAPQPQAAPEPEVAPEAHFASEAHFTPVPEEASEPEVAFDDDFDRAVASSLDVSPVEDDLAIDREMAASLDQDFQLDHHEPANLDDQELANLDDQEPADARQDAVEAMQAASEAAFDADFDNAVQVSLEDELSFESHEPEQHAQAAEPVEAHAAAPLISEDDFAGHFDQAMTDVDINLGQDMDLGQGQDLQEPELSLDDESAPTVEAPAETAAAEPELAAPEPAAALTLDDDFELSFRDALNEEPQAPAVEPVAALQPTVAEAAPVVAAPVPPSAAVEPVKPAASERSLEDELNALLGAMTARPMPAVREPAPTPRLVAQPASHESEKAETDDLDWNLDEQQPSQSGQGGRPVESDLDDLLASELDHQDFATSAKAEPAVDFDDDEFGAAFARSIEAEQEAARAKANSSDWLHSTNAEPARSWSRSTPTAAPPVQASFAQPAASTAVQMAAPSAPMQVAAPAYRSEPATDYSAYAKPAQAPVPPQHPHEHDDMPDVETVDVPERVVALADDLDIPELSFEEDQPAASAYDDLDAEFASLLTDMNATEIASAPTQSRGYDDESYNAGFNGYDRRDLRVEAPAAPVTPAALAVANDYDADDLPGSRPVSQADEFAADELDYDPELEEAMAIPGLAEREAAQPRRRGVMIAALVGAVVVFGGLGALAFSFGGKGGSAAPVIVKADNSPIKVKPENPGGTVVPNQDNKVYDAVAKGGGAAKPAEPVQQKLVNTTEQPVDLASKEPPQSRVVDLSPKDNGAAAGTDAASDPGTALPGVEQAAVPASAQPAAPASAQPTAPASAQPAAPAPKSEDRIAQVLQQDAENTANNDVVAVAPRKVKTMMVKPDGSLVPREDPAPAAAPKVAAAEPSDPAPQHVAPASDGQQTGTVASDAGQAVTDQADAPAVKPVKPAKKTEAKAQSANTPAVAPVAPARPSDQPVDIVGEVKPDQVASIDPAAAAGGGSWSMQIASQPTVESAQSTYQDLQRRYGGVLSGRTANIVKAEVAGKGTFYRVRVAAQSRNDAISLCTSYKAAGGNCFVSR
ncbi:SPOR domain-containing protein [Mesorhizobium sp. CA18]|uniref:SPOR domain-containing protein n=1 Tax=unclassified Mesorhizobium TaxID=325217 RepID=UPI001CCFECCC|nr:MULTISPECIES: SPOR domain-containing protein [unclassified Mesorhizobium]MBZ9733702.1 SPOR domain-containing protein [Mesorhizobium sp. CA9]MBZ9825375.1 SPOR domain-containing protein [Mesorhizobium sp. CA18]MBZ9834387.1 SPOR domain-containing protein [Mesorhizobium sp. CA2]MBZ9836799.1 SPOR domain-containing protein [Mesorhizobium sp. CA3]MBZ9875293.1 SPOR domain-containing protein [Mesorhizobium sp. Ca11]